MTLHPKRARTRSLLVAICMAITLVVAISPAGASASGVNVMTRNLYLGADLTPALTAIGTCPFVSPATCQSLILSSDAAVFAQVQATDFPARAKTLAKEIGDNGPALVALQEVAQWRSGTIGDPAPATNPEYDFLVSLQNELNARGLHYTVASQQQEADIESPAGSPYFKDFRLTMRDVVLARTDLPRVLFSTTNPQSRNYGTAISLPNPLGGTISFLRGWASIDVKFLGRPLVRFVDTHLESFNTLVRQAQAAELIGATGPLTTSIPAIVAGDLNSDPAILPGGPAGASDGAAFGIIASAGFVDTPNSANTCCYNSDLLTGSFSERIDHIMYRPSIGVFGSLISTKVVGTDPSNRAPSGAGLLWPSDHGGLVAGIG